MKLISIPEERYEEYRLKAIFECYKWDPQFLDNNTVASHVLEITEEEYEVMKTHTTKGENFCNSIRALDRYSTAAGCHHENSDGSGYPDGITEVPLEAELIKIADIYDALLNKRQYKEQIEIKKALDILKETLIDRHLINPTIFSTSSSETKAP